MSNLIVGPSSTSTGAVPQSIQTGALNAGNDDGISISDLWRTLLRRRKLVVTTAGTVFALSLINSVRSAPASRPASRATSRDPDGPHANLPRAPDTVRRGN